ncbi:MAG: low molecular weight phosphatase family protein, partial [Calditrichales bacterium]|nr:low molecular weight phosphatase family protein [Calditrichales bacterium]
MTFLSSFRSGTNKYLSQKERSMKIAFVCVENSCRSQIAEALAKKMFPKPDIEFVSAGTHPAKKVDSGTIKILKERQI